MNPLSIPIILASKSPRRKQLLEEAGFNFEIKTKDTEEVFPEDMPAREVALYLAELKAQACDDLLEHGKVLLTADSTVVLHGQIYNKPEDRADAQRILRKLSGNAHEVITGVCMRTPDTTYSFDAVSRVHFLPLSDEEIDYYIDNFKPYDKAGAYAIQEWIGHCKIERIEGTYDNIMGLPVHMIYKEIGKMIWEYH